MLSLGVDLLILHNLFLLRRSLDVASCDQINRPRNHHILPSHYFYFHCCQVTFCNVINLIRIVISVYEGLVKISFMYVVMWFVKDLFAFFTSVLFSSEESFFNITREEVIFVLKVNKVEIFHDVHILLVLLCILSHFVCLIFLFYLISNHSLQMISVFHLILRRLQDVVLENFNSIKS